MTTDAQDRVINTEGDPDNIHNRGTLGPKPLSIPRLANSPNRLQKVPYRAPSGTRWEEKSSDWAVNEIAQRAKTTPDATYEEKEGDVTVNRTEAVSSGA